MANWPTVRLPQELMERVENFIETNHAKQDGFTNKSQIMVIAVREFLRKYASYLTYLDYLEFENNQIKVMDHELGKVIEIKFDYENTTLFCKNHNSDYCDHIRFVWTLPRFKEELKKFKKPTQKLSPKIASKEDIQESFQSILGYSVYYPKLGKIPKKKMIEILDEIIKNMKQ